MSKKIKICKKQPRYPIYIISKGRAQYGPHTAKALYEMGVEFKIAVEPQEYEDYKKSPYLREDQILVLPFSNHGKGSGPARNWCWEHSKENGFKRHWLMDDNIQEFWRFHKNKRYKVQRGSAIFRASEDFVDRYENIALAGLQYKFFCADDYPYPPFAINHRIMSCFLIDNEIEHRWRGKYNEDVDLSLRVLKDNYATVLFYFALCGKMRTGTVKGGNTTEVYDDYKEDASLKKSKMLQEMHPDVVTLVERYGRIHHLVDMDNMRNKDGDLAKQNPLILKKDAKIINSVDNYGMHLHRNWGLEDQYIDESFELNTYPTGRKSLHRS